MREIDKQFGPWLRANTPNLAKKTVIRVAGYEEEVNEDNGAAPSPEWGNDGDKDELNILQNKDGSDQLHNNEVVGRVADCDGLHAQVAAPVAVEVDRNPKASSLNTNMELGQQSGSISQDFQAQLDDIDAELERFDGGENNGEVARDSGVSGVGVRMGETARVVKDVPLQPVRGSASSTQILELCSLKCTREDSSKERDLVRVSRKKQAIVHKNQSVEADVQPRQQP